MSSKRINFKEEELIMVLEEVEAEAVVPLIVIQAKHIKTLLWKSLNSIDS